MDEVHQLLSNSPALRSQFQELQERAIRWSAQMLSGIFRASDIVGRLGGDEFIVFLSGRLTEELVRQKGEEVCQRLQMTLGNAPGIPLTVSVGIRIAQGENLRFENLYQSADLAMYKAKKNGKHGCYIKRDEDSRGGDFLPVNAIPLSGLLEHMESGLALLELGEHIRILYVSPSFFRIIGMTPEHCPLPCPISRIIHPEDQASFEQALRQGLDHDTVVDHTHRVSADGVKWLWWHVRAYRISYDNPNPVMLITTTDISAFKERELHLQEVNRRLQTAFEQTAQNLWEVDMGTRLFTAFTRGETAGPTCAFQAEFPSGLLRDGWIHPDSAARFLEFAQQLSEGRSQGYGNFIIQRDEASSYSWATLSYRMLHDEAGRPVKAVGIFEYLPQELAGREFQPVPRRTMPLSLALYLILGMQANLTSDTVHSLWLEGKTFSGSRTGTWSCEQVLHQEADRLFSYNDRQNLKPYFSREGLLALYAQGERWLRLQYRRIDSGGNIRWVREIINLVQSPLTKDVSVFLYLVEHDRQHSWEQALGAGELLVKQVGLYSPAAARSLAEARMRESPGEACALAVLQLGSEEWFWADSGVGDHPNGYYIAAALSVALESMCILGTHSQGRLVAFFPEVPAREKVKRELEDAFSFVRTALASTLSLEHQRFVAGAVCGKAGQDSYTDLLERGEQLCQLWQNAPADTVAVPREDAQGPWSTLQQSRAGDRITVLPAKLDKPLSPSEKDAALQGFSAMLSAPSPDDSIRQALHCMGSYYHADRVSLFLLAENQQMLTTPYEWSAPGKHSIYQAASGLFLERFPILRRCLEEQAPGHASAAFLRELPNLQAYTEAIHTFHSERYSSLGALCLDIPGLSAINASLGFDYGSRMLWYVSKTMAELFDRAFLFRTWDAEFVVLCPDTTRPVFVRRCKRLRAALQRRYPKRLRMGYAWSEGVFTGKALVNEARSIMRCERVEEEPALREGAAGSGCRSLGPGNFLLYLQPKVHMPTGSLLGAEVLVRGLDQEGKLVFPDQFIPELEESGGIQDLDRYMLEHTLELMDQWRERGLPPIPLSVNLSRLTLFDPASPGEVQAILNRHPRVSPKLLELEITESGVSADSQALAEVLDRFRAFGLGFSLDDFGSEYANISIFTNVKFDAVKLDRSLIAHLPSNPKGQMLVQDLVNICHTYGMLCVAEGVEDQAQIACLTEAGCGYGQGYYFDRPLPVERFEAKYLAPAPAPQT